MFENNTRTTLSGNVVEMEVLMGSKQAIFLVIFNSLQIVFGSAAYMLEILFFSKNRHVYNSVSDKLT